MLEFSVSFIVESEIVPGVLHAESSIAANDQAAAKARELGARRFVMPVVFRVKDKRYERWAVFAPETPRRHLGPVLANQAAAEIWAVQHG